MVLRHSRDSDVRMYRFGDRVVRFDTLFAAEQAGTLLVPESSAYERDTLVECGVPKICITKEDTRLDETGSPLVPLVLQLVITSKFPFDRRNKGLLRNRFAKIVVGSQFLSGSYKRVVAQPGKENERRFP